MLLLRDFIAMKVCFEVKFDRALLMPSSLSATFLLVPTLMPSVSATLEKLRHWKDYQPNMQLDGFAGRAITSENMNTLFPPYLVPDLVTKVIHHGCGLQFVWREGVQVISHC